MAFPIWKTPRTVYNLTDGVTKDDFERIGNNVLYMYTTTGVLATSTNSGNDYYTTLPDVDTIGNRLMLRMVVSSTNTGPATLTINGLGARQILQRNGNPTAPKDLIQGDIVVLLCYNGSFRILDYIRTTVSYGVATTNDGIDYTATVDHISVLQIGDKVTIKFTNSNISGATLTINTLGTYPIRIYTNMPLRSGDIRSGQISDLIWDGQFWQLQSGGLHAEDIPVINVTNVIYNADSTIVESPDYYTITVPELARLENNTIISMELPEPNNGNLFIKIGALGRKILQLTRDTDLPENILYPGIIMFRYDATVDKLILIPDSGVVKSLLDRQAEIDTNIGTLQRTTDNNTLAILQLSMRIALDKGEDGSGIINGLRFTEIFDDPNDFILTEGFYDKNLMQVKIL